MKKAAERRLSDLKVGESAIIMQTPSENERLAEIGLVKGESVTLMKIAPLGDPVSLKILDAAIIIRRAEIAHVIVC